MIATRCHYQGLGSGGSMSDVHGGARGSYVWCPGGRVRGACTTRSNASWVMATWGPPPWTDRLTDGRTNIYENITFPQLRWRALKIKLHRTSKLRNFDLKILSGMECGKDDALFFFFLCRRTIFLSCFVPETAISVSNSFTPSYLLFLTFTGLT